MPGLLVVAAVVVAVGLDVGLAVGLAAADDTRIDTHVVGPDCMGTALDQRIWTAISVPHPGGRPCAPPRLEDLPEDLLAWFTRCGAISVEKYHVVDCDEGGVVPSYAFTRAAIDSMVAKASAMRAGERRFPLHQRFFMQAVERYQRSLQGARVLVFGAMQPWLEGVMLAYGAKSVTTVEFAALRYEHPALETIQVQSGASLADALGRRTFDVAVAVDCFDHTGLGRYGDPLAPDGDLVSMDVARRVLSRSSGARLLILSVPVGLDRVVFNLHRIYGRIRLPLLLDGWERVDDIGFDPARVEDNPRSYTLRYEPVFVLRSPAAADEHQRDEL